MIELGSFNVFGVFLRSCQVFMRMPRKQVIARVEQQGASFVWWRIACGRFIQDVHHWDENNLESIYCIMCHVNINCFHI